MQTHEGLSAYGSERQSFESLYIICMVGITHKIGCVLPQQLVLLSLLFHNLFCPSREEEDLLVVPEQPEGSHGRGPDCSKALDKGPKGSVPMACKS